MDKFWEWFTAALCTVGLVFAVGLCLKMLPPSAKDFWDIAGATGSAGAAIAAVWIATRDARRRNSQDLATARLAAAGMTYRIQVVTAHVQHMLICLDPARSTNLSAADFGAYADMLTEGGLWTSEELLRLIPLPNNCAQLLATAADQINAAAVILRRTASEEKKMRQEVKMERAKQLHHMLTLCCDRLNIAIDICGKAAGGFKPKQN